MLNELENKIRKAIPELTSYQLGERIFFWNTSDFIIYVNTEFNYVNTTSYNEVCFDDIDLKPIQLNHVFEYLGLLNIEFYLKVTKDGSKLYLAFDKGSIYWNLKSNLLSQQSEELIKYINEL